MSVPAHPLLALVDVSKNNLKVSLTNYIDSKVENEFGQLRNRIVQMIEHGVLGDVNAAVQPSSSTTNNQNEHLSTDLTTFQPTPPAHPIPAEPLIKQECVDINEDHNAQGPTDEFDDVQGEYNDYDDDSYQDFDNDGEDSENYQIDAQQIETEVNVRATTSQPAPSAHHITTSAVIKQECHLEESSTTVPINVHCNGTPNGQSIHVGIAVNEDLNAQVPIDEFDFVKEENDDEDDDDADEKEGVYLPDCTITVCEDCVKGICQPSQRHLVSENDNTTNDTNNNASTEAESEIGLGQDEIEDQSNSSQENDLTGRVIQYDVINESNQSAQAIIDQQSIPSTSVLRSSSRKRIPRKQFCVDQSNGDKRKIMTESSDNTNSDTNINESEIGSSEDEIENRPDSSLTSDPMDMPHVIDDSNVQSPHNATDSSLINKSGKQTRTVRKSTRQTANQQQNNEGSQSAQDIIEPNQQSMPSTSSGLRSSSRKPIPRKVFGVDQSNGEVNSDKLKNTTESSKRVKKAKPQIVDETHQDKEEEEQTVTQKFTTLEVNCTEPGCTTILESRRLWIKHLWTSHGQIAYQQLRDSVRHNQHGQAEHACTHCQEVFESYVSLHRHWKRFHQPGKFKCGICGFVGNLTAEVHNHLQTNHPEKKFECTHEECNRIFKSKHEWQQHERSHNGERPYKCTWEDCEVRFTRQEDAARHVSNIHFNLPRTVKKQKEQKLTDKRDPLDYVEKIIN